MPTFDTTAGFWRDYAELSADEKRAFKRAVRKLVEDLNAKRKPREGLRVKAYQRRKGVLEMTWAPDGRAFFMFGDQVREGEAHVIWLAIGGHDIF